MPSDTKDERLLINQAAYMIIGENAPQELPLYVNTRDRYFANPGDFLKPQESQDETLGFGGGATISTFSQVVFPVLAPILALLVNEAAKAFGKDAGAKTVSWVGSLFGKKEANEKPEALPMFSPKQLAVIEQQINTIAENETRRLGLKKAKVMIVRDAVIAKLALATG